MARDRTPETKMQSEAQTDDPRIILFGSDNPKNELRDIILNTRNFAPDPSPEDDSKKVKQCQKHTVSIDGKNVVIIDTPGLYISGDDKNEVLEEIKWSVAVANPGPHVFLFVETIYRPLDEKLEALKDFQKTFGEQANDFTMVVFTTERNEDEVKTIQHFRKLTYPFNHRYFIFNTKGNEQQQVTELLEKVAKMKEEASARFYTPKMLWEAEKAVKQKEEEQKQKDEKQKEKKQKEEKQKKEKQKEENQKGEKQEERWSEVRDRWLVIGAQVGATIGFLISAFFDLDSSAAGGVGSIVGVIIAAAAYLVVRSKLKTEQQSDSKHQKGSKNV